MSVWIDVLDRTNHTGQETASDIDAESSTDGQVLTSDGAGNAAWEDIPDLDGLSDVAITTPATGEILIKTATDWVNGTISTDSISANAVTLAKMAGGTDGNLITYDASGDPAYVTTGTNGQVLTSNGAGAAPTFQAAPSAPTLSRTITIEDPVTSEDISIFFTPVAITITEIRAVIRGTTPSVLWFIKHGTDRSAAGAAVVTAGTTTTSQTTGSDVTSFNDATIVADSFVWLETTTVSGTNDELSITIVYTED